MEAVTNYLQRSNHLIVGLVDVLENKMPFDLFEDPKVVDRVLFSSVWDGFCY